MIHNIYVTSFLKNGGVKMMSKRQRFTLIFTCFCFSKSLVIHF